MNINNGTNDSDSAYLIFINVVLYILTQLYSLVAIHLDLHSSLDLVEKCLSIVSKIVPIVSTIFLYIINKKSIDAFFTKIKSGKKKSD